MTPFVWVCDPTTRRRVAQLWRLESYKLDWAHHVYNPFTGELRGFDLEPTNITCKGWKLHVCGDDQSAAIDMLIAHRLFDKLNLMAQDVLELMR